MFSGSGVVDCWTRNPARLASTFSTLDDLAPGRMILGIGAWWEPLASKVGVQRRRPLKAMREIVEACRALLADGVATTLAGLGGGSGTTTYAENIGVMAASQSSLVERRFT